MTGQVFIITGAINSGKTTKILQLFNQYPEGDGFVSRKIFVNPDCWIGYELLHPSSQRRLPLAYKEEFVPPGFDKIYQQGPFHFSRPALTLAESLISEILSTPKEPIFIDEIGPLELRGLGFAALLTRALNSNKNLYITVRNACVAEVKTRFQIQNPMICPV